MSFDYPIYLELKGRPCLVIGGGPQALERVRVLLERGAAVTLLASDPVAELRELASNGALRWIPRDYTPGDLEGFWLVLAACEDRTRHADIWQEAQGRNLLLNCFDDPHHSNFIFPAVFRRGPLSVAVGTGGRCPALSVRLAARLRRDIGPEYGALAELLGELRPKMARALPEFFERRALWYRMVDSPALEQLRAGDASGARETLRRLLDGALEARLERLPLEELLPAALALGPACLTCSFQAEDVALLHMLRRWRPDIPVLFLDTGYHFPETYAYRDRLASEWGLNLIQLEAEQSVAEQESHWGALYESDPTRCCQLRKVEPLRRGLGAYEVWFTGMRREQSPSRAGLRVAEQHTLPDGRRLWKINPLAHWKSNEVSSYLAVHEIPPLPLYDQGYTSIGCRPCTSVPADASNPRSGRWGGRKLECGIHSFTQVETFRD